MIGEKTPLLSWQTVEKEVGDVQRPRPLPKPKQMSTVTRSTSSFEKEGTVLSAIDAL